MLFSCQVSKELWSDINDCIIKLSTENYDYDYENYDSSPSKTLIRNLENVLLFIRLLGTTVSVDTTENE